MTPRQDSMPRYRRELRGESVSAADRVQIAGLDRHRNHPDPNLSRDRAAESDAPPGAEPGTVRPPYRRRQTASLPSSIDAPSVPDRSQEWFSVSRASSPTDECRHHEQRCRCRDSDDATERRSALVAARRPRWRLTLLVKAGQRGAFHRAEHSRDDSALADSCPHAPARRRSRSCRQAAASACEVCLDAPPNRLESTVVRTTYCGCDQS